MYRIKDQVGEELLFKVKPSTRMEKIMKAYAERRGVAGIINVIIINIIISLFHYLHF
jgi:hypothetical protein